MDYPFTSWGPALQVLALIVLFALSLAGLAFAVMLAALPGRIAVKRGHPQAEAVNILGWVGLPTGVLWVVALVWAYFRPRDETDALAAQIARLEEAVTRLEEQRKGAFS